MHWHFPEWDWTNFGLGSIIMAGCIRHSFGMFVLLIGVGSLLGRVTESTMHFGLTGNQIVLFQVFSLGRFLSNSIITSFPIV